MKPKPFHLALFPVFLILYEFAGNLSTDMYIPALFQISKEFSQSFDMVQETITAWFLGMSIAQLLLGVFVDSWGRRPILLGGGALFLVATLACAKASYFWVLILGRMGQGFATGTLLIAGYSSIHALYEDHKATLILAWTSSASISSPMLGPLLGGFLLLWGDWRAIFWILLLVAMLAIFMLSWIMPESLSKEERHPLKMGAILHTYISMFQNRGFIFRAMTFGFLDSGIVLWISVSPNILIHHFHYSPQSFGVLQIFVFSSFILGAQSLRFLLKRYNRETLIYIGMSFCTLGTLLLLGLALGNLSSVSSVLVPMSIYALGVGLAAAPLTKETLKASSTSKGISVSLFFLISSIIVTLVGFLIAILPDTALITGILLLLVSSGAFLSFQKRAAF